MNIKDLEEIDVFGEKCKRYELSNGEPFWLRNKKDDDNISITIFKYYDLIEISMNFWDHNSTISTVRASGSSLEETKKKLEINYKKAIDSLKSFSGRIL